MYVHVRDQNDNATYTSTRWVPTVKHFLPCEDVASGSQQSGGRIVFFLPGRTSLRVKMKLVGPSSQGKRFFRKIRWPVRWVSAVCWRNNYFARNKEALPCGCRRPSCQPLHVHYSSDGSRSLTTLTTLRREHHGGGRRRPRKGTTRSRGRRGSGCARVEEYEGSLVRCGVRLPSQQNNRACG